MNVTHIKKKKLQLTIETGIYMLLKTDFYILE